MKSHVFQYVKIPLLLTILFSSCTNANKEQLIPSGCSDTTNITYSSTITTILRDNCYSCHGLNNPSSGYPLEDYSTLKTFALDGKLVGNITHSTGFNPMPLPPLPKLDTCDILKIKIWVEAGAPEN